MIIHRESKLGKVRPKWLEESGPLNVEQGKFEVCGKKRDARLARKLLAQRSKLITLNVTLKERQFLLQDQILILLIGVSWDIVKPIARGGRIGIHHREEQL